MRLSAVLKDARSRAGLSLRQVAARAGISNGYLSLIESGQVRQPAPKYLHALAETYGISYALLMELAGHAVASQPGGDDVSHEPEEFVDLSAGERQQVRAFASFLRASRSGKNEVPVTNSHPKSPSG